MKSINSGSLRAIVGVALALVFSSINSQATDWSVPGDFATIQAAIDDTSVADGDRILLAPGDYAGAEIIKAVEIRGEGKATITSGPTHGSGMKIGFRLNNGSTGATFFQLNFRVDLGIIPLAGVVANDVTVSHCVFENAVQAISNWRGNGWDISHNVITDLRTRCGGGIGILVGDYTGGAVVDNVIAHNKILGTLHVAAGDCGGYSGTGIVLYADFRWSRDGAANIAYNRVIKNKVSLESDNPGLVDVNAVELTDTQNDGSLSAVILENSVGFNDLRGTVVQIVLTPANLDEANDISRNLGENRGHGLHPALLLKP